MICPSAHALLALPVTHAWLATALLGRCGAGPNYCIIDKYFRANCCCCSGETPVLIASTVVEVGIDEPEASVMLVENASCFGMAQLHQLRGRVGRGSRISRCFLMAPPDDHNAAARLRVMERSHNGLHIAEADLRMRCAMFGEGRIRGLRSQPQPNPLVHTV